MWYRTGTVTVTNGSRNVTGSGTAWFSIIAGGWGFRGPDGRVYEIESVSSDTAMLLAENYLGTTLAGQAYAAYPTQALTRSLTERVSELIATFTGFVTTRLAGLFGAGSVSAPGVAREGDANTGIYWPADDALAVAVGGVERMRFDATGSALVGTSTPVAGRRMVVAGGAVRLDDDAQIEFGGSTAGFYGNSTSSTLIWFTATTERMRIDASGNVGVGTSSPAAKLDVRGVNSVLSVFASDQSGSAVMNTRNSAAGNATQWYVSHVNENVITGNARGGYHAFWTDGAERMRITSLGQVGIGTPTPAARVHIDTTTGGSGLIVGQLNQTGSQVNIGIGYRTAGLPFIGTNTSSNPLEIGTRSAAATIFVTSDIGRMRLDSSGNWILHNPPATPPTLATNGDLTLNPTSNTNLRFSYRGTDGVTRFGNIALTP